MICGCGAASTDADVDTHLHATVEMFMRAYGVPQAQGAAR